ncbi:MAG: VOC family protein [Gemmatimonadaceae bacterium]
MSTNAAAPQLALRRVGQIAIPVRDLERAVGFYRDTLSLPFLFAAPPNLAFFDCGGTRLMLALPEREAGEGTVGGGGSPVVYYTVDDIAAAHAALLARGVELESDPHLIARLPDRDVWMAFLRDSEGNLVGLTSETRR